MSKTPKYQKKASATYKEKKEAEGYKRTSISFWVRKVDEKEWKKEILELIEKLKKRNKNNN